MEDPTGTQTTRHIGLTAAAALIARAGRGLAGELEAEGRRLFLFAPILLGIGIAAYFSCASEPTLLAAGLALLITGGAAAFVLARIPGSLAPIIAALLVLPPLGFTLAKLRTGAVAAPVLAREIGPVRLEGRLVSVSFTSPRSARFVVAPTRIERLEPDTLPARMRLTARGDAEALGRLAPGVSLRALAVLMPPRPPVAPGDYDFARAAYFDRLGAVGYTLGPPEVLDLPHRASVSVFVEKLRAAITMRLRTGIGATAGPEAAGIAAALVTGDRGGISDEAYALMRDSGLAHLISISGLHLALVAGGAFWAVRLLLALFERPALLWPTKKIAALAGLAVNAGYLALSGAPVSAVRSSLMLAVVFLAILVDRPAISMRHVAVAALAILALMPESLLEPGFQMSFAAVVGLIAFYEAAQRRDRGDRLRDLALGWKIARSVGLYWGLLAATSLVAGLATAPYSAYHFNRFSNLEIIANLLAVPLMGFAVMPAALIGVLLMPLGIEEPALWAMGQGVAAILAVASGVSHLPGAVTLVPSGSAAALGAISLGLAWMALMTRPWRWAGLGLVMLALALWALAPRPLLLVDATGKTVGLRAGDGSFVLGGTASDRFAAENWLEREGQAAESDRPGAIAGSLRCDALGCAGTAGGYRVAFVRAGPALAEDCRWADIVVSTVAVRHCPSAALVIDRFDLARGGAHAVYAADGRLRVETVAGSRGNRPWSAKPR